MQPFRSSYAKKINIAQIGIFRNIPTTFQHNPFSSVGGVVSPRFEFNWRGRLGAIMKKLSTEGTTKYPKIYNKVS